VRALAGPRARRIARRALDVPIEVMLVEDLVQSGVERMRGAARQALGSCPHRRLVRVPLSFAHRHR